MITRNTRQISTVSDFLDSSDRLSQICNHIEKNRELQTRLRKHLDSPLDQHVTVADYRQQTLVLHTDSAAWAARLRYRTPDVLKVFKSAIPGIRTIRIKVAPPAAPERAPRRAQPISADSAGAIRQVADKIGDTALRTALYNIANNTL